MSHTIEITIRLFGAFRKFHGAPLTLSLPTGCSVTDVKAALGNTLTSLNPAFTDRELLDKSALADDRAVLAPDATLQQDSQLAILPPVCGG